MPYYESYLTTNYSTNLLAYWPLNESAAPLVDTVNSWQITGTIGAGVSYNQAQKIPNTAYNAVGLSGSTNGSTALPLELSGAPSRMRADNWTISCWFRRASGGNGGTSGLGTGGIIGGVYSEPLMAKGGAESETAGLNVNWALALEAVPNGTTQTGKYAIAGDYEKNNLIPTTDTWGTTLSPAGTTTTFPTGRNARMIDLINSTNVFQVVDRVTNAGGDAKNIAHTFANGDYVRFGGASLGANITLTTGSASTWYVVCNANTTNGTFQAATLAAPTTPITGITAVARTSATSSWCNHVPAGNAWTPDTNWHFAVATFDGTLIKTYLDGSLVQTERPNMRPCEGTTAGGATASSQYTYIGAYGNSAYATRNGWFNGNIQHVAVWNTDIGATAISNLYTNGTTTTQALTGDGACSAACTTAGDGTVTAAPGSQSGTGDCSATSSIASSEPQLAFVGTGDCSAACSTTGVGVAGTPDGWYDQAWGWRMKVTFDRPTGSVTVTDIPQMVQISTANITDYANFAVRSQSSVRDGLDIRFTTDVGTLCPYEIEHWNTSGTSIVWVKVPSIPAVGSTYLWMYYGNAAATAPTDQTSVWSNNYVGVWHLNQTSGNYLDSTSNGLTSDAPTVTSRVATGLPTGPCPDFVGTVDASNIPTNFITIPHNTALQLTTFTLEAMVKWDGAGAAGTRVSSGTGGYAANTLTPILSKGMADGETAAADINYLFGIASTAQYSGTASALAADFEDTAVASEGSPCSGSTALNTTNYYHIANSVTPGNGGAHSVFLNGIVDRTNALPYNSGNTASDGALTPGSGNLGKFGIGTATRYTSSPLTQGAFDGLIDEVRISSVARHADYIRTCASSNSGSNQTYATPEQVNTGTQQNQTGTARLYVTTQKNQTGVAKVSAVAQIEVSWANFYVIPLSSSDTPVTGDASSSSTTAGTAIADQLVAGSTVVDSTTASNEPGLALSAAGSCSVDTSTTETASITQVVSGSTVVDSITTSSEPSLALSTSGSCSVDISTTETASATQLVTGSNSVTSTASSGEPSLALAGVGIGYNYSTIDGTASATQRVTVSNSVTSTSSSTDPQLAFVGVGSCSVDSDTTGTASASSSGLVVTITCDSNITASEPRLGWAVVSSCSVDSATTGTASAVQFVGGFNSVSSTTTGTASATQLVTGVNSSDSTTAGTASATQLVTGVNSSVSNAIGLAVADQRVTGDNSVTSTTASSTPNLAFAAAGVCSTDVTTTGTASASTQGLSVEITSASSISAGEPLLAFVGLGSCSATTTTVETASATQRVVGDASSASATTGVSTTAQLALGSNSSSSTTVGTAVANQLVVGANSITSTGSSGVPILGLVGVGTCTADITTTCSAYAGGAQSATGTVAVDSTAIATSPTLAFVAIGDNSVAPTTTGAAVATQFVTGSNSVTSTAVSDIPKLGLAGVGVNSVDVTTVGTAGATQRVTGASTVDSSATAIEPKLGWAIVGSNSVISTTTGAAVATQLIVGVNSATSTVAYGSAVANQLTTGSNSVTSTASSGEPKLAFVVVGTISVTSDINGFIGGNQPATGTCSGIVTAVSGEPKIAFICVGSNSPVSTTTGTAVATQRVIAANAVTSTASSGEPELAFTVTGSNGSTSLIVLSEVKVNISKVQTGISRLKLTSTQTRTGTASITVAGVSAKTITGTSAIQNVSTQSRAGVSRLKVTTTQDRTGVSLIVAVNVSTKYQTGVGRIKITSAATRTGVAKITNIVVTTKDQTGRSRLKVTTTKDQTGLGRIKITSSSAVTGVSNISAGGNKDLVGVARIQTTSEVTRLGVTKIVQISTTTRDQVGSVKTIIRGTPSLTGCATVHKSSIGLLLTGRSRIYRLAKKVTKYKLIKGLARVGRR